VKLLDFGLGKLAWPALEPATVATMQGKDPLVRGPSSRGSQARAEALQFPGNRRWKEGTKTAALKSAN
jgi:hypothetical protein